MAGCNYCHVAGCSYLQRREVEVDYALSGRRLVNSLGVNGPAEEILARAPVWHAISPTAGKALVAVIWYECEYDRPFLQKIHRDMVLKKLRPALVQEAVAAERDMAPGRDWACVGTLWEGKGTRLLCRRGAEIVMRDTCQALRPHLLYPAVYCPAPFNRLPGMGG